MRVVSVTFVQVLVRAPFLYFYGIPLTVLRTVPLCRLRLCAWAHPMHELHCQAAHVSPIPQDSGRYINALMFLFY